MRRVEIVSPMVQQRDEARSSAGPVMMAQTAQQRRRVLADAAESKPLVLKRPSIDQDRGDGTPIIRELDHVLLRMG
jgi:hypothetical protein